MYNIGDNKLSTNDLIKDEKEGKISILESILQTIMNLQEKINNN
jgi:hypothetical protein